MSLQDIIYVVVMNLLEIKDKLIKRFEDITEKKTQQFNKQIEMAEQLVVETGNRKDDYLLNQASKRTKMMIKGNK